MRKPKITFVLARTVSQRASLQHALREGTTDETKCGRWIGEWSRAYQAKPIEEVLCHRCAVSLKLRRQTRTEPGAVVFLDQRRARLPRGVEGIPIRNGRKKVAAAQ